MVSGDPTTLRQRTDNAGKPKVRKDGNPDIAINFGVAIPKTPGKHWWDEEWGLQIYQVGAAAFPNESQIRSFAWKITDGDSTEPNKKGKIPANNPHYVGHWVLWFSQGWQPKLVNADGTQELTDPNAIKTGYFVRVMFECTGNGSPTSPGVYLNPAAVALMYVGEVIQSEVDTSGFSNGANAPMPAGAQPVPAAQPGFGTPGAPPPSAPPATPSTVPPTPSTVVPGVPSTPPPPAAPGAPAAAPPAMPPATPAILGTQQPPGPAAAPSAPMPAPTTGVAYTMTAKAQGFSREALAAQGWSDQQMIDHGMMVQA